VYRGVTLKANMRGQPAQKHVIVARSGPVVQNIVGEPAGEKVDQRHGQRVARLLLNDRNRLPAPVDISQPQLDDVAGPQPGRKRQQRDGRIPGAHDAGRARVHDQPLIVVIEDRHNPVRAFHPSQIDCVDQIGAAGERQKRPEVRHRPKQGGRRIPGLQRFQEGQNTAAVGVVEATEPE
jgi:hypothetical protein